MASFFSRTTLPLSPSELNPDGAYLERIRKADFCVFCILVLSL